MPVVVVVVVVVVVWSTGGLSRKRQKKNVEEEDKEDETAGYGLQEVGTLNGDIMLSWFLGGGCAHTHFSRHPIHSVARQICWMGISPWRSLWTKLTRKCMFAVL